MLDDAVNTPDDQTNLPTPDAAQSAGVAVASEATEAPAQPAKAPRKRRRASSSAAESAADPDAAPAQETSAAADGAATVFPDGAVLTRPAASRTRTRRPRKPAAEAPAADSDGATTTVDAATTEAPTEPAAEPTVDEKAEPARPARRRSPRRRTAEPEAQPEEDTSEQVAAAVARQARRSRGRRPLAPEDKAKALNSLVAALTAGATLPGEDAEGLAAGPATKAPETEVTGVEVTDAEVTVSDVVIPETPVAQAPAEVPADVEPEAVEGETGTEVAETSNATASTAESAAEASDTSESSTEAQPEAEGETGPRHRRRRRGGRRRRRGGDNEENSENSESSDESSGENQTNDAGSSDHKEQEASDADHATDESNGESGGESNGEGEGSRRRRRRRRRRGEDTAGAEDDPSDVVVRVREPRARGSHHDEVTGIEGSTRMEAKRQRRKEGRAAGRQRRPILSEAEFLARRESVVRKLLVRQREDYSQIAVLEDDVLVEHYVDRPEATSLIGNVYLGRVQNVLPSMEAVFIDIGRGRNAVLYAGEVDWDSFKAEGEAKKVEKVFKSGQMVLVQVTKDPIGAKGARLTSHISLPGRYVVYAPGGHLSGISRKLSDTERHRLRTVLGELVGDDASVIIRTAAEGVSEEELARDVNRLKAQWEALQKKVAQGGGPHQLYTEPDLTVRIVRDLFTEDFSELVVAGAGGPDDAYDMIQGYVSHVAPHLLDRVKRWDTDADGDLFAKNRIDEQISKALERKVFLPSGGSLVIDRTEAMTVIDVNTGKFTGAGGNLEATVTSNNLEAAEEIVRQLRLRDLGGIIVVDFIDMVLPSNRELLIRRLTECLGRDRTRHQVAEVTSLGLVQMTRKRIGTGLAEAFTEECEVCGGRGYVRHDEPVDSQAPADGGERHHGRRRSGKH